MALRMERQAENAARIADYLASHPLVQNVNYPGLHGHVGAGLHAAQATHGGSLLSFETGRRGNGIPRLTSLLCLMAVGVTSWPCSAQHIGCQRPLAGCQRVVRHSVVWCMTL